MKRTVFFLLLISIVNCSCYTYRIFPESHRNFIYSGPKKDAIILNPEMSEEYSIMKAAGLFNLVTSPSADAVLKIRLQPLKKHYRGAPGAFIWIFLIGQVPMNARDEYEFEFTEIQGADSTKRRYSLDIAMHYWFWDMFVFHKRFEEKAGQALLADYYGN